MAAYHINPNAPDNTGSGTAASPKKTLAGITLAPGDKVLFLRGTTYSDTFSPSAPGTAAQPIEYAAYAYADGSDNEALPRPIISRTAPVSTYASANKHYVSYRDLDVRGTLTVANDTAMFYLGMNAQFVNMRVDSNCGAVAVWNSSNVLIEGCELNGVSHTSANTNHVVVISADSTHIDNIKVRRCTLNHKGGGSATSHVMRAETNSVSYDLTRLVIEENVSLPPNNAEKNPNIGTIGLRLARCPGVVVRKNIVRGVLSGVYVNGVNAIITGGRIEDNDFSYCYNFGIHLPGATRNFKIRRNVCWHCGTDAGASYYGRGIEISSAAGQGQNGGHVIAFNSCCYARNWGGPADNASEGVGIGLDDGTDSCEVYGNYCAFNEGNGIQQYGGIGTMTGGHRISGNWLESNCTASFKNRRTGGTTLTNFNAHIGFSAHKGKASYVVNNLFKGATLAGISETTNSDNNLVKANNIFIDVRYPVCMPSGRGNAYNNIYYSPTVVTQRYSDITVDANGAPTFPALAYTGSNDYGFDPKLDNKGRPKVDSPCIGAGRNVGKFPDLTGRPFALVPAIGPYEYFAPLRTL